jgi:hypothetical protein
MKKFVLLLILFFVSIPKFCLASDNDKYQQLFYPNGLPLRTTWDGTQIKSLYELEDEVAISDSLFATVYSEKVPEGTYQFDWSTSISIIRNEASGNKIISTVDASNYYDKDFPYNSLECNLNKFNIFDDKLCIHFSLWAGEGGSGISGTASDTFFLLKNDFTLTPILEVKHTGGHIRRGDEFEAYDEVYFYIADVDNDGSMEILTREYNFVKDISKNKHINSLSPNIKVYKYDKSEQKYKLSNTITKLPANAHQLDRAHEYAIDVS